jgi:hypothetical protein
MRAGKFMKSIKIQWSIRVLMLNTLFGVFLSSNLQAKTAKEIDASVDVAIERFYKQVEGADVFVKASKGINKISLRDLCVLK